MVKLCLLLFLFALAAFNRWRLTDTVLAGNGAATRHMVRSIAAETAVVILIFAVAAAWRFTPPPRSLAIAAAQPAYVHIHASKAMVELTIAPGRAGRVAATIAVADGEFNPLQAKEVTLVLSNPTAGIEPYRRAARRSEDGSWRIEDFVIPIGGKWNVRVDVLIGDFEIEKVSGEIAIRE
jgi:copper transport protein